MSSNCRRHSYIDVSEVRCRLGLGGSECKTEAASGVLLPETMVVELDDGDKVAGEEAGLAGPAGIVCAC